MTKIPLKYHNQMKLKHHHHTHKEKPLPKGWVYIKANEDKEVIKCNNPSGYQLYHPQNTLPPHLHVKLEKPSPQDMRPTEGPLTSPSSSLTITDAKSQLSTSKST